MAQYESGNVPGPGTVVSGTSLENYINELIDAFNSGSEGTTTPSNAAKGMIWSKSVSGAVEIYCYTGTTNVLLGTVDTSSNVFEIEESAIDAVLTSSGRGVPTGSVITHAAITAPPGYLTCDGSTVSRTTYADLFSVIGTTYGSGDGSTTFEVPDFRGEFLRGRYTGRAVGSVQSQSLQSHTHGSGSLSADTESLTGSFQIKRVNGGISSIASASGIFSQADTGDVNTTMQGDIDERNRTVVSMDASHGHSLSGSTDSAGGDETRPRNIAILYCIKF